MKPAHAAARRHPHVASRQRWFLSRWLLVGTAVGVVALVAVLVLLGLRTGGTTAPPVTADSAAQAVVQAATQPDAAALAAVGTTGASNPFRRTSGAQPWLDSNGHPVVFYTGADFCPFCAARRWSMVVALSRFGTFENLALVTSSSTDVYPNTNTFSFHGSSYHSEYLEFLPVETSTSDNQPLDTPTSGEMNVLATYDAPPYSTTVDAIPFLDVANQWISVSGGYSPALISGMSWQQVAAVMRDPTNAVGRAIMADANIITAAVCTVTGEQPASVCGTPQMTQIVTSLQNGRK